MTSTLNPWAVPAWAQNIDPSAQRLITGQPLGNLTPDFLAQLNAAGPMGSVVGPDGLVYGQVGVQSSGEDGNGFNLQGYQAFDPNHNVKGDAQGLFGLNGDFAALQANDNGKYDGWWAPLAAVGAGMALGAGAGTGAAAAGSTAGTTAGTGLGAGAATGADLDAFYGGLDGGATLGGGGSMTGAGMGASLIGTGGAAAGGTGAAMGSTTSTGLGSLASSVGGAGNLGSLAGALIGAAAGGASQGGTTTNNKAPWAPAIPWLTANLQSGQALQNYYAQNPFNPIQRAAYGNLLGQGDYVNQMVPGLLSQMSQNTGFDPSNPRARPAAFNFGAAPSGQPMAGLLGSAMKG